MLPVVYEALKRLGIEDEVIVIKNSEEMKKIGLKYTPALEINGKIIYEGKYPGLDIMIKKFEEFL